MYQKPEIIKSFDISNIECADNKLLVDAWGQYGNYSNSWGNGRR